MASVRFAASEGEYGTKSAAWLWSADQETDGQRACAGTNQGKDGLNITNLMKQVWDRDTGVFNTSLSTTSN